MQAEVRRETILSFLYEVDSISIKDVAERCNVAEITARRDLDELSSKGLIIRTHGGAVSANAKELISGFKKKDALHREAKEMICKYAASLINENDIIYLDCGTTVYRLAKYIRHFKNIRILTNSLPVISELAKYPNIKVNLIGGELDNERLALYGPTTENLLLRYKANKAFIGAGGISLASGLSTSEEKEASVTMKMAESATDVFLLADSSKLEKSSFFTYAPITMVNTIITDYSISKEIYDLYINNKVNILIAKKL